MRFSALFLTCCGSSLLLGCGTNYAELPTYSTEHHLLQAVVEVPAGTNHVQHYDATTHQFRRTQRAGRDRVVEFLPYPGNYGFVPSTHTIPTRRYPTGRPLAILVLAESQPAGTVLEVLPIGMLLLDEGGSLQQVVIAVPARPSLRILPGVTTWAALLRNYPAVRTVLGHWFQHRSATEVHLAGWKDEKFAQQQIQAAL